MSQFMESGEEREFSISSIFFVVVVVVLLGPLEIG